MEPETHHAVSIDVLARRSPRTQVASPFVRGRRLFRTICRLGATSLCADPQSLRTTRSFIWVMPPEHRNVQVQIQKAWGLWPTESISEV